jgi:hypothetical protein
MPQEGMDITRVILKIYELQKLVYDCESAQVVIIEVSRMKEPDTFGRTVTAYAGVEVSQAAERPKKKTSRKKK